ncbi:FMN-binding protein [bacterium]|nr:FMN-binding protein [bacterium]MBU1065479.1 FMN-binding protein [bacterium]MBU1634842.1 FMN-binding protein [bacterium]MBU1873146.1 FMN-binding protein [bacterium]
MTKSYRLILVLTATAVLSGLLLSFLNLHTSPLIEAHQNKVLNDALSSVLPGCDKIEEQFYENKQFYFGYDAQNNVKGIAFLTEGNGFQSKLRILVGMDAGLTQIVKIRILEQKETPGLGTKIETDPASKANPEWFPNQFDELNVTNKITYLKNQAPDKSAGEIMAITGATISSKAVIDIINAALIENSMILKNNTDLKIGVCPAIDAINETSFGPELVPEGAKIVTIDNKTYFLKKNDSGSVTGVAFIASGEGFQSTIKVLACMNPDFSKLLSIEIIEQDETEGWGTRLVNDTTNSDPEWFLKQFTDLYVQKVISTVTETPNKQNGEVQSISGATVSSDAIIKMLNASIQGYRATYLNRKVN